MNMRRRIQLPQGSKGRRPALIAILLIMLLGIMVAGAAAQDGGDAPDGLELNFVGDGGKVSPENAKAANDEAWIKVTQDAYISSAQPDRNFGAGSTADPIRFGFSQTSGLGATRPLLYFDVAGSGIPSDAKIEKAEVHIYLANIRDSDTSRGYAAHSITQNWQEWSVTWNSNISYGPEIGRGTLGNNPGWQVTDITNLARNWLTNPGNNRGVILIGDERPDQNYERDYFSKESATGLYPRLYIKYDTSRDDRAPVAEVVIPSAGAWSPPDFIVGWEGSDPNNSDGSAGSGIRWYDVYYSTNQGSSWRIGRAQVTSTETNVNGAPHLQRFDFYARARDNAGNEGPAPSGSSSSQSWTRIDAEPPEATMDPLPQFTPHHSFTVSWHDNKELNESGIRYFDVQYRENEGPWLQLVYHTTATSTTFDKGQNGVLYEFRARAVDNVGNEQPWGDAQAETLVWIEPLAYIIPFDPPVYQKLDGPENGDGFTVQWIGLTPPTTSIASFDVEVQRPGNPTWISWISGTTQTSATYELQLADPDGTYSFRARARDTAGTQGDFHEELQGFVIVDRFAPFFVNYIHMPIVAGG